MNPITLLALEIKNSIVPNFSRWIYGEIAHIIVIPKINTIEQNVNLSALLYFFGFSLHQILIRLNILLFAFHIWQI